MTALTKWMKPLALLGILIFGVSFTLNETPLRDKYFQIAKNIEIFTNLYKELNFYYVDELDPGQLMRTGIDAMVGSLDPYTNYISESEIEGYRFITEGRYNGIGAQVLFIRNHATITETYEGSPAQKAGLIPGDQILAVDGKSAVGKTPEEVDLFMKGAPGTEFMLSIQRPGEKDPLQIGITREEVQVPNVPYFGMVNENVGYVALTTFTRNAGRNIAAGVKALKQENPNLKGMILDLRNNGGGLLTEAVNVSNVFIPKDELVVTTKGKVKDWDRSFKTLNPATDDQIPLVVLINKNSASASEIVAGVIQDLDRGVLLGQRSYGKGLVQNTRDIGFNSKVKLTTAKYYIPSGRCIQSVEYNNGEPVDIPDTERAVFKTRNGRSVLDGGGVKPDFAVKAAEDLSIVKALQDQYYLFDFVTEYALEAPKVDTVADLEFKDWTRFTNFLQDRSFAYETDSEKALQELLDQSEAEGFAISEEAKKIRQSLATQKNAELEKHKESILNLIEKDLASRQFFQDGKIKIGLRNDPEIKEAIALFNDMDRYQALLGK